MPKFFYVVNSDPNLIGFRIFWRCWIWNTYTESGSGSDPDRYQNDPQHWSKGAYSAHTARLWLCIPGSGFRSKIFESGVLFKIQSTLNLSPKFVFCI
jgi:hypothetical protein